MFLYYAKQALNRHRERSKDLGFSPNRWKYFIRKNFIIEMFFGGMRKNGKGIPVVNIFKQIIPFFTDVTETW